MGLWWKCADVGVTFNSVVRFAGDPDTMSKWVPILWRFNQNYHLLKVCFEQDSSCNGYNIYFASGDTVMRCRKLLVTPYVAVRVGPKEVYFWVEDEQGRRGELTKTGFVYTPIGLRPIGNLTYAKELEAIRLAQHATFV